MGCQEQGREGGEAGAGGERLARPGFQGAIRCGAAGVAPAGAHGAAARPGGKPVPAERPPALRGVRQVLLRPRRQERPVRLLRLLQPVPGRGRSLHRPLLERPEGRGPGDRQGQGADSHRGDHHRAGYPGGRGD